MILWGMLKTESRQGVKSQCVLGWGPEVLLSPLCPSWEQCLGMLWAIEKLIILNLRSYKFRTPGTIRSWGKWWFNPATEKSRRVEGLTILLILLLSDLLELKEHFQEPTMKEPHGKHFRAMVLNLLWMEPLLFWHKLWMLTSGPMALLRGCGPHVESPCGGHMAAGTEWTTLLENVSSFPWTPPVVLHT